MNPLGQEREAEDRALRLAGMVPSGPLDGQSRRRSRSALDALFRDLVSIVEPALFVEAGAFEAETSLLVAGAVPGCRVIAFEANPYVHQKMSASTDYAAHRVEYRNQALSGEPGEVPFLIIAASASLYDDRVEGYNSLLRRTGGDWLGDVEYEEVTVRATTLDHEFAGVDGPFAMWMDVEGATEMVLSGAGSFLDRCDLLKIEVEETPFWQGQWLAAEVVAELARHGLEPLARDVETDDQYNVVFGSGRLLSSETARSRVARYRADQEAEPETEGRR